MIEPIFGSQWRPGATRQNDCGQTCCGMFLAALGIHVTIDSLRVGDPTGLTAAADLVRLFSQFNMQAHIEKVNGLDEAKPNSILLINYAPISQYAQDVRFKGWHWLVYLGKDGQDAVCNDPDYWGNRINEGDHKHYPYEALKAAFRPYSARDLCTAVVVDGVIEIEDSGMAVTKYVNNPNGLNVRETPAGRVIASLEHRAKVTMLDYQENGAIGTTYYSWRPVVLPNKKLGYVAESYLVDTVPV